MLELIENVKKWAEARNLIKGSTPERQFLKLVEEMSEFEADPADSIGDTYVVLIILCEQLGYDFAELLVENDVQPVEPLKALGMLASNLARKQGCRESLQRLIATNSLAADIEDLVRENCLQIAWDEIKDRKGKMVDGVFVKEADL